eukprot:TRINITY_DN55918_c0_g1_i1.p1 TRINITY_DN55918_c0_g1~~TRINITY_DN55918_c0_g1_i1.p1  ORF type:complete len:371 (+),score=96.47 TRINITY_DN55918_c0_g1_i1:65-1114(+)
MRAPRGAARTARPSRAALRPRGQRGFAAAAGAAAGPPSEEALHAAVRRAAGGFSVEVTPAQAAKVDSFAAVEGLGPGTEVTVTYLPGSAAADTVAVCRRLRADGMAPVAHLPVREFASAAAAEAFIGELSAAGCSAVLVIAGGAKDPAGDLCESLQLLRSGVFSKHGIRRLRVAAHPGGHPEMTAEQAQEVLLAKIEWALTEGVELELCTQFGFDPAPLLLWEQQLRRAAAQRFGAAAALPGVSVGVAGPAQISSLLKFAAIAGVRAGSIFVSRNFAGAARLAAAAARSATPDDFIVAVARRQAEDPACLLRRLHYYPFGGFAKTLRWAAAVADGRFRLSPDATGFELL